MDIKATDLTVLTMNETWYCPVRCGYCHITQKASLMDKKTLSTLALIKVCKEAKKYGFKEYRFSGGEPTVIGDKLFEHAKIVLKIVGKKPILLTSGYNLSEEWCEKAVNLFSAIYVSLESPIKPLHSLIRTDDILHFIREYSSDELPLKLGCTLIRPESYKHLYHIFSYLYEGTHGTSFPQLSSPTLKDYIAPTQTQLKYLQAETAKIYADYGIVPWYFSDIIGSVLHMKDRANRYVANLNPDGAFYPYSSLADALNQEILIKQKSLSERRPNCIKCEWFDCCNPFDNGIKIPYSNLCSLRKTLFQGILNGLEIYRSKDN